MAAIACPNCQKTITARPDGTTETVDAFQPCYQCQNDARLAQARAEKAQRFARKPEPDGAKKGNQT